jgi:LPS O-antigen subunit length determinant protein (WzzB/FepE family)
VANLKEKIQDLEEELSLERNRGNLPKMPTYYKAAYFSLLPRFYFSAAAEIHDAMESYESQVVRLNKQLADMAVQLSSKEKQFDIEQQTFKEKLEAAEKRVAETFKEKLEAAEKRVVEISSEREGEEEKFKSQCQDILDLKQQCSELQREVEVAQIAQTDSVFLQKGQNDKAADLLREREKLLKQVCSMLHVPVHAHKV